MSVFSKPIHAENSTAAQRERLKTYLETSQKITTLEARNKLDVLHPAGRIQELRGDGLNIITHWRVDHTPEGKPHRVAEYVLMVGEQQTPAATGIQGSINKTMGEQPHE